MSSPSRTARHVRTGPGIRAGLLLAAATLTLAACGTDSAPNPPAPPAPSATPAPAPASPAPAPASEQVVAWTDTTCTALAPVVATLGAPPAVDQNALPATREAYLRYIDDALSKTNAASRTLGEAGPPPVDNGEQIVGQLRGQVDDLQKDLTDARAGLVAANPSDASSFGPAIAAATNVLASFGNSAQAVGSIVNDSQLRPAFEQTPACAPLRG